ncbi:MaoC/PaaZ C-terminal domain-containing protein [Aquisalimonas asiatica]|uniref:Acyl dehydratase n=1 Tax=Aquisalimonas asiatica TaxID=406100 RepID=A0A1H8Q6E2_9GAMM|nr:MaoC/PaaZ C-terminal domain-containing protein [Aquisalimonas asiatica]SEO49822.1 Acyl dehydratase [Aquisalimonas asiatica]
MSIRYLDAIEDGESGVTGTFEVTEADVVGFAGQYDPQPFHLDDAAARDTLFGRLAASGWHTTAIANRLLVNDWLHDAAVAGAEGFDNLRWRRPVYPGDVLRCRYAVTGRRASPDPRFGVLSVAVEVLNQDDDTVMSLEWLPWIARAGDASV